MIEETSASSMNEGQGTEERMGVHEMLERMAADMCENYCKYTHLEKVKWFADRDEANAEFEKFTEEICEKCPLIMILG